MNDERIALARRHEDEGDVCVRLRRVRKNMREQKKHLERGES